MSIEVCERDNKFQSLVQKTNDVQLVGYKGSDWSGSVDDMKST